VVGAKPAASKKWMPAQAASRNPVMIPDAIMDLTATERFDLVMTAATTKTTTKPNATALLLATGSQSVKTKIVP